MKFFCIFIIFFCAKNIFAKEILDSWDLYKTIESSTVRINIWENFDTENESTITGGTGIVINKFDNFYYLLTNSHVVLEIFCNGFYEEGCEDKEWSEEYTIVVDHPNFEYEYVIENLLYRNLIYSPIINEAIKIFSPSKKFNCMDAIDKFVSKIFDDASSIKFIL